MTLSSQFNAAAKAFTEHTNTVIAGSDALNLASIAAQLNVNLSAANFAIAATTAVPARSTEAAAGADADEVAPVTGKRARKKREDKPKDPNAPKRPLTAYFRYLQETRPGLIVKLGQGNIKRAAGDLSAVATEQWNKMSAEEKEPYHQAYQAEKAEYANKIAEYNQSIGQGVAPTAAAATNDEEDDEDEAIAVTAPTSAVEADSSDDDSDDEPPAPVVAKAKPKKSKAVESVKAASPEIAKKTPKKKAAAPTSHPTPIFNSINPDPAAAAAPGSQKKRKSDAADDATPAPKKKRGRPSNASKEAAASSAAAETAASAPTQVATPVTTKKDKGIKSALKKRSADA